MDKQICAICGLRKAVTKDHVPPKGIFSKPRPNNLIKIPACFSCNNGASALDEKFLVYLGLHVGGSGGEGENLFNKSVLSALRHNKKLKRKIIKGLKPTYLATKSGIIHGKGYKLQWDSKAHDAVVDRMVRGLYYHHFKEVLGGKAKVKVHWFKELKEEMVKMSEGWARYSFGKGEVVYRYGRAEESPLHSVWIFQFYRSHWAGCSTKPIDNKGDQKSLLYVGG